MMFHGPSTSMVILGDSISFSFAKEEGYEKSPCRQQNIKLNLKKIKLHKAVGPRVND